MQNSIAIAVVTATLAAIGTALGVVTSAGGLSQIHSFEDIMFVRQIKLDQVALFGKCPLEREIIIERTGETKITWYVQNSAPFLGCGRATDPAQKEISEEQWEEPRIARMELKLTPSQISHLVSQLENLSWDVDWKPVEDLTIAHAIGCPELDVFHNSPTHRLWVTNANMLAAALASDEQNVPSKCIAKERANGQLLDAAFASFAPLLPNKYELRDEVARRLDREDMPR
jgi:hypothetical protein